MRKISKPKCFSYAASFGLYEIPNNLYNDYKNGIEHLNYISVREDRGKELVESITKRNDTEVLIDPTMLLERQEWETIIKKPKVEVPDNFILTYFLGRLCQKRKDEISRTSDSLNCKVINIMDIEDNFYDSSPQEFLYLIKNAKLICTDSFHACVFSILFDKSFIIFERDYKGKNMNSRIDTLLSKFSIENRKYNDKNITDKNINHNYSEAYKILEKEKKKSILFLKKALDIKESENI